MNVRCRRKCMKSIKIFVSYAHRNHRSVLDFLDRISDHLGSMRNYDINIWWDAKLTIGKEWNEEIISKIENSDLVLFLISPSFLNSKFIMKNEVPLVLRLNKRFLSIAIAPVDTKLHDFNGLEKYQYYTLNDVNFIASKAYNELKSRRKDQFTLEVAKLIKQALDKMEI